MSQSEWPDEDVFKNSRSDFFDDHEDHMYYSNYVITRRNNRQYFVKSKANFSSSECKCKWSSLNSVLAIKFNKKDKTFHTLLFKQLCKTHKNTCDDYEWAESDMTEVEAVLKKLLYGEESGGRSRIKHSGNMKDVHDPKLCLACKNNVCKG